MIGVVAVVLGNRDGEIIVEAAQQESAMPTITNFFQRATTFPRSVSCSAGGRLSAARRPPTA